MVWRLPCAQQMNGLKAHSNQFGMRSSSALVAYHPSLPIVNCVLYCSGARWHSGLRTRQRPFLINGLNMSNPFWKAQAITHKSMSQAVPISVRIQELFLATLCTDLHLVQQCSVGEEDSIPYRRVSNVWFLWPLLWLFERIWLPDHFLQLWQDQWGICPFVSSLYAVCSKLNNTGIDC